MLSSGRITDFMPLSIASIKDFGAIGDGITDDRAAIQRAIDASDEIHFPDTTAFYRVSGYLNIGGTNQRGGKRLIGHRPCRGGGPVKGKPALIEGDGLWILLCATGETPNNRAIEIVGLSASNREKPVLQLASGVDARVENCWFVSTNCKDATVLLRESYNVTIAESTIGCHGGGFAITAYQQCNMLRIRDNRLGGGSLGGGIHVEQSGSVKIEGNLFEIGVYGIVVGSGVRLDRPKEGMVEGAGACHSPRIIGNYFEQVQYPLVMGSGMGQSPGSAVFAALIESNQVGSGGDFPLLTIGRLLAGTIRSNSFWPMAGSKSPVIYVTSAPGGDIPHPSGCAIDTNACVKANGPFIGFEKAHSPQLERSFRSLNQITQK